MGSRAACRRPVLVRRTSLAAAATVALLAAGAATLAAVADGGVRVVLKDVAFNKPVVRIHPGARVTWSWEDPYTNHNIHSRRSPRFKGASTRQKGTYTVRFTKQGTYRYECTIHPGMYGTVVVK